MNSHDANPTRMPTANKMPTTTVRFIVAPYWSETSYQVFARRAREFKMGSRELQKRIGSVWQHRPSCFGLHRSNSGGDGVDWRVTPRKASPGSNLSRVMAVALVATGFAALRSSLLGA